jgi:hypothetical protein
VYRIKSRNTIYLPKVDTPFTIPIVVAASNNGNGL